MSYVPASSKGDLLALLAAAAAAVAAIEWVWRRQHPAEPDDPLDEPVSVDRPPREPGPGSIATGRVRPAA